MDQALVGEKEMIMAKTLPPRHGGYRAKSGTSPTSTNRSSKSETSTSKNGQWAVKSTTKPRPPKGKGGGSSG